MSIMVSSLHENDWPCKLAPRGLDWGAATKNANEGQVCFVAWATVVVGEGAAVGFWIVLTGFLPKSNFSGAGVDGAEVGAALLEVVLNIDGGLACVDVDVGIKEGAGVDGAIGLVKKSSMEGVDDVVGAVVVVICGVDEVGNRLGLLATGAEGT
ncbi:uncharacterized protein EDB93DRAFT_1102629 [Suillus bovinus]|uniref:uncharacterized protein n=1 Tax=Suillus bovinus TaxID=48563 RepID=UPI001B868AD1|nr:uncharacterized protein EDB93DRAFT_1102629 [Suillus bovinus]KAG2153477.1 hypothetical protein EDB93DRAFT_1102629 [Suillus bovinus]